MNVVYVAPYVTSEIVGRYGLENYSVAGQNQIRGVAHSIQQECGDVQIVSPITPRKRKVEYHARESTVDKNVNSNIVFPPAVNILGIDVINRLLITLTTAIIVLKMHRKTDDGMTLFYNYRLPTGVPALVSQLLLNKPAILEYEDGLFARNNSLVRVPAVLIRCIFSPILSGAICTSSNLEEVVSTDNTAILRGFPSVGFPDELPESTVREKTIIMFSGSFDAVRGIDQFLSTIPRVQNGQVEFWISGIGTPEQKQRIQRGIKRLDDPRVTFYGTLDKEKYREKIADADIFVNFQKPTKEISQYTFPSKLLDYFSAGGIVVSTKMGDLEEVFEDILIFVDSDPEELKHGIEKSIQMHREGPDRAEQTQKWINDNCTPEAVCSKIKQVYRNSK